MHSQMFVITTTARFEGIESDTFLLLIKDKKYVLRRHYFSNGGICRNVYFILKYEKDIWINSGLNPCTSGY